MKCEHITLIVVAVIGVLVLAACDSDSDDVRSLNTEETQVVVPATDSVAADAADGVRDNEARMMAFTQCLRDQGFDVLDPVVDSEGNVQKPELAEGVDPKREDLGEAYEACSEHLGGFSFERKRVDVSEQVDQFVALATCLREKGYDVDDPTAETLDQWGAVLKFSIDWEDPTAVTDYEECSGDTVGEGSRK